MNPKHNDRSEADFKKLVWAVSLFFLLNNQLWRCHLQGQHQLVIEEQKRLDLLKQVHDDLGHKRDLHSKKQVIGPILVAPPGSGREMVQADLSYLPRAANPEYPDTTYSCDAGGAFPESVHRHYEDALLAVRAFP
jgi:hypothetical protein